LVGWILTFRIDIGITTLRKSNTGYIRSGGSTK